MTIQTLGRVALAGLTLVIFYVGYLLLFPWRYQQIGEYSTRWNRITNNAEILLGERWTRFQDAPYADPVPEPYIRRLRVQKVVWGADGLLVGEIYNRIAEPVQGRLAFRIVLRNKKDLRFIRDRSIRATVDFPPDRTTPFILNTDLATPDPETTLTEVEIVPAFASGL